MEIQGVFLLDIGSPGELSMFETITKDDTAALPSSAQVKVHQRNSSGFEILRVSLSSLHGGFLKPKLLREIPDPVTGYPLHFSANIWPPETFRGEPFFWAVTPNT